ncbi:alpha/beta hydrolase [Leifsonia sp. fls2-241-R2A-40a]|uniref:alpha/beta hydrolase n=1 Tax=Leifsonia sp. fls2-241-R2A-40a TaxID=3040290 RepID=UPI00254EF032|nr:alpha/beta hydrolase [Leifsonia sp. fls2-241-R2A-40a]
MTRRVIAVCALSVVAIVGLLSAPAAGAAPITTFDVLKGMNDEQQNAYLEAHPELNVQLANTDPDAVHDEWAALDPETRKEAIETLPEIVGNLDGIDYGDREVANRRALKQALAAGKSRLQKHPEDELTKRVLGSLTAIQKTLKGKRTPARHLVGLSLDRPPLAAIAIGDLDTASDITFVVPGMGTYTDDMQLWTQSAQNLYDEQGEVGAPTRRAVVSWIGYATPPPGIDAALGDYASRGAPLLTADLRGVNAARVDSPPRALNVVAHSYGTTTAANALAGARDLGVYAFVMLGSAGIENRIPNVGALGVQHAYAGEAAADGEAQFGRFTRRDPRGPSFGATVISVDGDTAADLLPVTGHAPVLHSAWNDDPLSTAWSGITDTVLFEKKFAEHLAHYGYLDAYTESLRNTAVATVPGRDRMLLRGR